MTRRLTILSVALCAATAMAQTPSPTRTVQALADGTLAAPTTFLTANGIATYGGTNTWTAANTFSGAVTLGSTTTAGSLNIAPGGSVTFGPGNAYGWSYNPEGTGQVEIDFPGGTAAMYTATNGVPVLNHPGKLYVDELEVGSITTQALTTGSIEASIGGSIAVGIEQALPDVMTWSGLASYAGDAGVTVYASGYGNIPAAAPVNGQIDYYFPRLKITSIAVTAGTVTYENVPYVEYRTLAQTRGDQGIYSASASLDYPSIAAGAEAALTITVAGATLAANGAVALGWGADLPAGIIVKQARVSADNTVRVILRNESAGAIDPAAVTCKATVHNF